jgi:ABC-type glycerol-3-phosphate transport system substrate-binding protein
MSRLLFLQLTFVLVTLGACRAGSPPAVEQTPTDLATDQALVATQTTESDSVEPPPVAGDRQLVVWAPDFFLRSQENSADRTIDAALTQFEQNRPGVRIEVQPKALSGEASAFAYLQSAQQVAPDILPDVVLLRTDELWQAAELGLIPPLTDTERTALARFYPFAQQAVIYGEQAWGIPYAADLVHLAYHPDLVPSPPPTWEALQESGYSYLFPAGSRDGYANESALLQYLGAGGQLTEDGSVTNPDALEAVFEFYLEGIQQGVIPEEIEQYAGLASVWTEFAEQQADMADIATTSLLTINEATANIGYRFVPTLNGSRVSLADTWAFAVLAQEGEQRRVALELLDVLLEPTIHGEWSQLAHRLPTQAAALELWPSSNDYYVFLRNEVAPLAASQPNGRLYQEFSIRFQEALRGVLNGSLTPADAVLQVRGGP